MSTTIRRQIITDISVKLPEVTMANGYQTDCGQNVQIVKPKIDPSDLPALVIWPMVENTIKIVHGKVLIEMPVRIEGLAQFELINPAIFAEKMLGDIIQIMTSPDDPVSSLVESVKYASGGTDEYPESGQKSVGTSAVFNIEYKTIKGNPYAQ